MEVSALVAACHSKACAPPPAGKGGSDRGGGAGAGAGRVTMRNGVVHIGGAPVTTHVSASGGFRAKMLSTGEAVFGSTLESLRSNAADLHKKANGNGPMVGKSSVSRKFLDDHESVPTTAMGMHSADESWTKRVRAGAEKMDWDSVPVTTLPKGAKLIASESSVKTKYIKRVLDGEPLREGYEPQLIRVGRNTFMVYDGHHRMAMHSALGNENSGLKVRIAEMPDLSGIE